MFYLNDAIDTPKRYDMAKFFDSSGDWYDPLTSCFAQNIAKLPYVGERTITYEARRPELLSSILYDGETQFWWVLLMYNNILNVNDLEEGTIIRYPSQSLIEDLYSEISTTKKAMEA